MNTAPPATDGALALAATGLNFGQCVEIFAAQQDPRAADVIERARQQYQEDGAVEIDNNAILSEADGGDYVMAWVWVPRRYRWTYADHQTPDGTTCPYSGRPVETGVVDEDDPDADQDQISCPAECPASAIERN